MGSEHPAMQEKQTTMFDVIEYVLALALTLFGVVWGITEYFFG